MRALLVTLLLAASAAAQAPAKQAPAKLPLLTQARPFVWAPTDDDRGLVRVPVGRGGGWAAVADPGYQVRLVPSFSSDLTIEVILWPSLTGVDGKADRFLLQFPLAALGGGPTPLVVAFHPYGVSEKSPFQATALPALCQERGWLLLAPYGLIDTNYATPPSQQALDAALKLVDAFLPIDRTRVFGVGFSMGALNALSYGHRHQDTAGFRFAGIVDHSGPLDTAQQYAAGDALLQQTLADADHFGAPPGADPFAYERVSPAPLLGAAIDPQRAAVLNLLHVPIYLHCNLDDPNVDLVAQTLALHAFLTARGGKVALSTVHTGTSTHAWSTLDVVDALSFLEPHPLVGSPPSMRVSADRTGAWLATSVDALPAQSIARFALDRVDGANALELYDTRQLDSLTIDLAALGLSAIQPLYVGAASGDGTGDTLRLRGYAAAPASVKLFDVLPTPWSYDGSSGTVVLTGLPPGSYAQAVVQP